MITYDALKTYLRKAQAADPVFSIRNITYSPGPASNLSLQRISPNEIVFIRVGGGAGALAEQMFDQPFIDIRTIGPQNDYTKAESLANWVDHVLMSFPNSSWLGNSRVLYIAHVGGRPDLLDYDSGSRYHFTCSYIAPTEGKIDAH